MNQTLSHAWIDGRVVPMSRACVPITDSGYLHGDGLFETLRVYQGVPVFLADHLKRMRTSANELGVRARAALELVPEGARALIRKCGAGTRSAAMRINLTWTGGHLSKPGSGCRVTMLLRPYKPPSATKIQKGVSLTVWPWPRAAGNPVHRHKTLSYAENMAARRVAVAAGAFDAVFVNSKGHVTEGTSTNVFLVEDGVLITPPLDEGLLPGVTRAHIVSIARRNRFPLMERAFSIRQLLHADEVFVANSLAEVVPVARIELQRVGRVRGTYITDFLRRAYHMEVADEIEKAGGRLKVQ